MKITTLVPAYKPKYLIELLTCLRHQTVKPDRVIFSDDSPGQAFIKALTSEPLKSAIADLNVTVIDGARRGGWANFLHVLAHWGGATELFHILLDDDILYPDFYARHLQAHQSTDTLCSVSRRWTALESGQPMRDLPVPDAVANHPHRLLSLPATILFQTTAGRSTNWLGEYSNAVFRAEFASEIHATNIGGISYMGLEDLGIFLSASLHKPVSYINEHLGYFRLSGDQNSSNPMGRPMKLAHLGYLALAIAGRRVGMLSEEQAKSAVAGLAPIVLSRYQGETDMAVFCEVMPALATGSAAGEAAFLERWGVYTAQAQVDSAAKPISQSGEPPRIESDSVGSHEVNAMVEASA